MTHVLGGIECQMCSVEPLAEDCLVGTGGGGLVGVGPTPGGLTLGGGPVGCGVGSFADGGGGEVGRSSPPFGGTGGGGGWKLSPGK